MATSGSRKVPAVGLQKPNHISYLHNLNLSLVTTVRQSFVVPSTNCWGRKLETEKSRNTPGASRAFCYLVREHACGGTRTKRPKKRIIHNSVEMRKPAMTVILMLLSKRKLVCAHSKLQITPFLAVGDIEPDRLLSELLNLNDGRGAHSPWQGRAHGQRTGVHGPIWRSGIRR